MIHRIHIEKNEVLWQIDDNVHEQTNKIHQINLQPLTINNQQLTTMIISLFQLADYTLQAHLKMAIQ